MDEKQLAADLYAQREDSDEWGEPDDTEPAAKRLSAMVSVRLERAELERIQARAQALGESVSAYVRDAVLRDLTGEASRIFQMHHLLETSTRTFAYSRNEAPLYISDESALAATSTASTWELADALAH